MTNQLNTIEVKQGEVLEVVNAIKELSSYKTPAFEGETGPKLFDVYVSQAFDVTHGDRSFYVIQIIEGLGGDQVFLAVAGAAHENEYIVNNEAVSKSDLVAMADAAMRKFLGQ